MCRERRPAGMSESAGTTAADPGTTFDARIDADRLATALDAVAALVDECRVRFDDGGLRGAAADPATVALVDLRVDAAAFERYEAGDGRIGLDLERLLAVLSVADRGDSVALTLDPETRRLDVSVGDLSYSLALLDPDTVRAPPDRSEMAYELPASATLSADQFDRGLRAAEMVGDHVAVGTDPDAETLFVRADGDTDEATLALPAAELASLTVADARSLFSLSYLRSMVGAMPGDASVDLGVGTEAPLALSFSPAADVAVDYLLAPRRRVD